MNFHNRIRLGDGEHEHPHGGEEKDCDGEEETALSHVALVEFCGRAGKKHFFFQSEDVIRVVAVTGVQTCALPISIQRQLLALWLSMKNSAVPRFACRNRRSEERRGGKERRLGRGVYENKKKV